MLDHMRGEREGVPYFFYNSVEGIRNIIKMWRTHPETKGTTFNVICARTPKNKEKLESLDLQIGSPDDTADFHFITSTAFEGVGFFNPEGRTYVLNDKPAESGPRPLSSISGKAKELSDEDSKLFGVQLTGLETICNLYENDQQACIAKYPEWSQIISKVGIGVCKSLSYNKARVRAYDQGKPLAEAKTTEKRVKNTFKVGLSYSIPEIKKILDKLGFEKPKGTVLSRWFHIKKTTKNGAVAYKILAPLDCFELD